MNLRLAKCIFILCALLFSVAGARAGILYAAWDSATDVPVVRSGDYDASGLNVNFTLKFAPLVGSSLTVVKLTGLGTINGTFANLAQNQAVTLTYAGQTYSFVANYNGGTGNDLVLQWAGTRAVAWGYNASGQLGNGSFTTSNLPVSVTASGALSGKTIVALAGGKSHSLALCSDGTLAAWGLNAQGQIGSNGGSGSMTPVLVSTLGVLSSKRVIAIAAGESHSLALCSDGTVAAWGYNSSGQLGNGGTSTTGTPTAVIANGVLSGKRVVAIAAGQFHSMALLSDGTVAAWGNNFFGQLGTGTNTNNTTPILVKTSGVLSGKSVIAIAAGQLHSMALCSDGMLATWGQNADGQLGNDSSTPSNEPVTVTTAGTILASKSVTSIAAGGFHSLALCSDGTIAAWGQNTYGQLGTSSGSHYLPAAVNATGVLLNKTVTAIAGGATHSLAQCSDGTLAAWGRNAAGELGNGNYSTAGVPVAVSTSSLSSSERFQLPAAGANALHTLAIVAFPPVLAQLTAGTLIGNGSFESSFNNWSISDLYGSNSILAPTTGYNPGYGLFSVAATDGTHAATSGFDGNGPGIVRFAHDVAVTAAEPWVRFDYRAGWNMLDYSGSTQARTFSVTIEPAGGGPVLQNTLILTAPPHTKNLDTGAQAGAVDLSAYIGTAVRVCFDLMVPEYHTGPAFFQLDNVRTASLLPASTNPITRAATGITLSDSTVNATVNANGSSITVEYEYGTTTAYGCVVADPQSPFTGNTDAASSATLTGLAANTTWHYRVKTTDGVNTKFGADATFTTLPLAPIISDSGNSFLTNSSATFYATVDPNGASTTVSFEYGPTTAYGSSTPAWQNPLTTNGGAFGQISGLAGGVTLHWRVKAQNAGGITYSADATYTPDAADPGAPAVNTLPPTLVNRNSATLNGIVNASGATATVDFQFGTTTNYGSVISATPSTVGGNTNTAIAASRNGLSPGTTYHYRARSFASNFYVYGPDVTFTTPSVAFPAASTGAATDITQTTALLRGYASANNGPATTVSFEYGLDTNYGSAATIGGTLSTPSFVAEEVQIPVSGNAVTYHYRIKAKNNIGTTYGQDMTFTTPDIHEARLYALTFDTGTLSPAFDKTVTTYAMSLPFETTALTLTPTASSGIASVTVNGISVNSGATSGLIPLNAGANVLNIVVTALDGTTQQTYTVTVTRAGPVAGDFDLSFSDGGTLIANIGVSYDTASSVAVQPDGRIVVAGSAYNGNDYDFALARYNPDGSADTTFNGTGKVVTDFGISGDMGAAVALQSDGKIVVAGASYNGANNVFALARYNPDGSLDTSFGGTGKITTPVGPGDCSASSVAVQSDGKIVAAGSSSNGADYDFALVRYDADGTLDSTFNGTGKVITDFGAADDFIGGMALQSDGKIVVAGSSNNAGKLRFALARYNAGGTLDATLNGTGKLADILSTTGDDSLSSVALQSDGKIVAAGYSHNGSNNDFAVLRYNADGTPDSGFHGTGKATTDINAGSDFINGVALQNDGKIVVAGYSISAGKANIAAARYHSDGNLDATFHGTGTTTTNFGLGDAYALGLALQEDGKIVVAGYDTAGFFDDFIIVRFLGDGPAINVRTDAGTNVFDGISSVDFGSVLAGASASATFTIQNTGIADLTGLGITLDGNDSAAFSITANPTAPVSPAGATTFTVRFLPGTPGPKTAALHIATNVTGHAHPYDIALTGAALTPLENWRQQFFGNAANAGDSADSADPFHTGIPNLTAFGLLGPNQNPAQATTSQLPRPQFAGDSYVINFTQPDGTSGLSYGAEWKADLSEGIWLPVADTGAGNVHIFSIPIGNNPSIFVRLVVTRP